MTTLTKAQVTDKIIKISTMSAESLREFAINISLSDIDGCSRSFLNEAIEIRGSEVDYNSCNLAICSDVKADEIGL